MATKLEKNDDSPSSGDDLDQLLVEAEYDAMRREEKEIAARIEREIALQEEKAEIQARLNEARDLSERTKRGAEQFERTLDEKDTKEDKKQLQRSNIARQQHIIYKNLDLIKFALEGRLEDQLGSIWTLCGIFADRKLRPSIAITERLIRLISAETDALLDSVGKETVDLKPTHEVIKATLKIMAGEYDEKLQDQCEQIYCYKIADKENDDIIKVCDIFEDNYFSPISELTRKIVTDRDLFFSNYFVKPDNLVKLLRQEKRKLIMLRIKKEFTPEKCIEAMQPATDYLKQISQESAAPEFAKKQYDDLLRYRQQLTASLQAKPEEKERAPAHTI